MIVMPQIATQDLTLTVIHVESGGNSPCGKYNYLYTDRQHKEVKKTSIREATLISIKVKDGSNEADSERYQIDSYQVVNEKTGVPSNQFVLLEKYEKPSSEISFVNLNKSTRRERLVGATYKLTLMVKDLSNNTMVECDPVYDNDPDLMP